MGSAAVLQQAPKAEVVCVALVSCHLRCGYGFLISVGLVSPKQAPAVTSRFPSGPLMPSGGCAFSTACSYNRGGGKGAGMESMVKRYRWMFQIYFFPNVCLFLL